MPKLEKFYSVPEKVMADMIAVIQQLPYNKVANVMMRVTTLIAQQNQPPPNTPAQVGQDLKEELEAKEAKEAKEPKPIRTPKERKHLESRD